MQTAEKLPVKKKIGRPSKYSEEILKKTAIYLQNYQELGDPVPSIAGLAQELDTTRERLHRWEHDKDKSAFRHMLNKLRSIQERSLLAGGLTGGMNSAVTKLCLSKHGYHDNPQGNQGNGGITVQVNRGGVVLKSGGQTLEVSTEAETTGTTLEHKPD